MRRIKAWFRKNNVNSASFDINWPEHYVIALGIAFSCCKDFCEKLNFYDKLNKLENVLNLWSIRSLSLIGRINVVKNLAISKLVYNSSVLTPPKDFAQKVNERIFKFIWNYKPDKIKRNTLIRPLCKGGLNMVNFEMLEKSLKAAWVKRLADSPDNSNWKSAFLESTKAVGGTLILQCNYNFKNLLRLDLPQFYKDVLETWQTLQSHEPKEANDIKKELIWNNQFITIDDKSFFFNTWHKSGVNQIADLLDENNKFLTFNKFCEKFQSIKTNFLIYNSVIDAIPTCWRKSLLSPTHIEHIPNYALPPQKVSAKAFRSLLIERSSRPSATDTRIANLGLDLKAVYLLPFKITIENKLRCFQFKIIHNIIPSNLRLWQMKIKPSPVCNLCKNSVGTIEHLFWNCEIVMPFWKEVLKWWNQKREENIQNIKAVDVLYGFKPESSKLFAFNHFVLIAKYHIFTSKIAESPPSMQVFLALLDDKVRIEEAIATKNNRITEFKMKWKSLSQSF